VTPTNGPILTIADSLLVCGAGMLLWQSFFPPVEEARDAVADATSPPGDQKPDAAMTEKDSKKTPKTDLA